MDDTRVTIERMAALASLSIDSSRMRSLEDDFSSVISFVDAIHDADTTETAVTDQVTDLENIFRSDDVVEYPHHRSMFEMTPHRDNGLYRVPGVFTDEPEEHGS